METELIEALALCASSVPMEAKLSLSVLVGEIMCDEVLNKSFE